MKLSLRTLEISLGIVHIFAPVASAQSDLICGQKGWDTGIESFVSYEYCNSHSHCAMLCSIGSGCVSFAYVVSETGWDGGNCELYKVPAKGNFVADDSSPYKFCDKTCPIPRYQCGTIGRSTLKPWKSFKSDEVACRDKCKDAYEPCQSCAYGDGECLWYHDSVGGHVISDASSEYAYFDRGCQGRFSSTTTLSKTTTKVNTSTKTAGTSITTSTIKSQSSFTTTRNTSSVSTITKTSIKTSSATNVSKTFTNSSTVKSTAATTK